MSDKKQISQMSEDILSEWLKDFQRKHNDGNPVDNKYMMDLACALQDDIPFGYEASMRLSNWIFVYLNQPPFTESIRRQMRTRYESQKNAAENLREALNEYIHHTQELTFDIMTKLYELDEDA